MQPEASLRALREQQLDEATVLGALMCHDALLADTAHLLSEDAFTSAEHQAIYQAVKVAGADGKPDMMAVSANLSGNDAAWQLALEYSADCVIGQAKAKRMCEALKDRSDRRRIAEAAQGLALAAQGLHEDIEAPGAALREAMDRRGASETVGSVPMQDALDGFWTWCNEARKRDNVCVESPWWGLNKLITGFFPGEVTILAGRPSNGKTAAGLNIAYHAAAHGAPVGVVSLEMSRNLLLARIAAGHLRIDARKFRSGRLSPEEMESVHRWCGDNWQLPLHLYDQTSLKPSGLRGMVRRWKRQHGVRLVVMDYLQLMDSDSHTGSRSRENEVSEISRAVKRAAVEHDVHFVLLSQLNRDVEKRKTAEPMLADLRESGAIEQDADNVLMIRPWDHTTAANTVRVGMKLAKARNDQTGNVQLVFMRSAQKFADEAVTQ